MGARSKAGESRNSRKKEEEDLRTKGVYFNQQTKSLPDATEVGELLI